MTLLGHLRSGAAIPAIRRGGWDLVVLQEQSTRPLDAPALMFSAVQAISREVALAGARIALFLTWASRDHPEDQRALDAAYRRCASIIDAVVVPVGPSWQRARVQNPSVALYAADGSHPGPPGTYLAACTFYATLAGRTPEGITVREVRAGDGDVVVPFELSPEDAAFLQRAAWETVSSVEPHGDEEVDQGEWGPEGDVEAEVLREVSLVHGLAPHDADDLLTRGNRVRVPAGTRLFSEGERGRAAHIVLDGEVHLQTTQGFDGTFAPWNMGFALELQTRSLLGEPYGCTATAETDLTVLVIRDVELEALAIEKPALTAALMRNVTSRE
ncbi:MAG TPA: cyclic nucleotide-binding domain-containing protein [Chloroflexota bacterium]|nr:cyclic nucleotide-binding domain-containing protein [Chloroflexota bacterium]